MEIRVVETETAEIQPVKDALGRSYGTGRRKNSIARVWVKLGTGKITVNNKDIDQYFGRLALKMIIRQSLVATKMVD